MQGSNEIRPEKTAFIFMRVAPTAVFFGVMAVIATVVLSAVSDPVTAVSPLFFWSVVTAFAFVSASVAYKKERYVVGARGIVAHSGGLVSDRQADLELRNVTHVKQFLPWIRYRFFDVGDVLVESAGSSGSHVILRSVRDPEAVYQMLKERLRDNGYSLQHQTLLHEEQPDPLGVMVEVAGLGLGSLIGVAWVASAIFFGEAGGGGSAAGMGELPAIARIALIAGPVLVAVGGGILLVARYLDLRRRNYRVFNDVVVYEEGFFTRTNAFIPYENIADADEKKTLIDRILGLSDVSVSCQGSGQEVKFRRLRRGTELKNAVAHLVTEANETKRLAASGQVHSSTSENEQAAQSHATARVAPAAPGLLPANEAWRATMKPRPLRAVSPLIFLLPIVPLWAVLTLIAWAQAKATTYFVNPTSIGMKSGIFSVTERQFSYDKVTGAVVKSSPFDRLFGTLSIVVWSIGTSTPLTIAHVRTDDVDVQRLLRNLGIEARPSERVVSTKLNFVVWVRAALAPFSIVGVVVLATTVIALAAGEPAALLANLLFLIPIPIAFIYRKVWVSRQSFTLHPSHVELQIGIWWKQSFFARYDDLKKVSVVRYPGGKEGNVQLYVAGEQIIQQGNNQSVPMPYTITGLFIEDTSGLSAQLDELLAGRRVAGDTTFAKAPEVLLEVKPAVSNTMLGAALISLLLLPFAIFILPLAYLSVTRRSYRMEAQRVVRSEGILYRRETSVLYEKLDSLRQDQGALGKMLGNGSVTLFTAGSSRPDLSLKAVKDWGAMYRVIRERYEQQAPVNPADLDVQRPSAH